MDLQSIYKNRLPKILRGNAFWQDVVVSIAEESQRLQDEIAYKRNLLDVMADVTETELLEISQFLGYTPDLSLFEDDAERIEQLRNEVQSIVFRILNKSSIRGYNYIFKNIGREGLIYNMFADNDDQYGLVRAANTSDLLSAIETYAFDGSVLLYPAQANFSETLLDIVSLDTGRILDDSNALWYLDEADAISLTKHLAIEYAISNLFTVDGVDYLMTPGLLLYLDNAVHYNRKLTEIPHVGGQVTIPLQTSAPLPLASATNYVVTDLQVVGGVTSNYDINVNTEAGEDPDYTQLFHTIAIGRGVQDVTTSVTGLADQLNAIDVVNSNIESNIVSGETRIFAEKSIRTNTVFEEVADVGSGTVETLSGTLNLNPVKPGTVTFRYRDGNTRYSVTDGIGRGDLFQTFEGGDTVPIGSVDYATGDFSFSSVVYLPDAQNLITTNDSPTDYFYLPEIENINLSQWSARKGAVRISFTSGGITNSITDDNVDGALGAFSGSGISTEAGEDSTINYSTGELEIYFVNPVSTLTIEYQLEAITEPNDGEEVYADYEVDGEVDITEAGAFNEAGELVAYATFPPFRSPSSVFHISVQFLVASDA